MDVAVTELRGQLSSWLARARDGEDVVVTDRGVPIVRLVGIDASMLIERLTEQGVIAKPITARRPRASGRTRPVPRHSVADRVSEQR
ncbi:MAG: type II toxin-antitoxin system Phd/YefM family antitoxin [Acidimicrobiia bacterium]